ncbi:hypothetical protein [Bradyrhizobium sp.]|jgi:hypothetical protein|uniref:hypothetical protein n=1 Tax=Bradyrhizobium sp. TaxID=376 RepID=UPI003C137609
MSMDPNQSHASSAASPEHVAAPIDAESAAALLKDGPRGAYFLAGVSVGLLFVGWLLFYFLLFMPRGNIG